MSDELGGGVDLLLRDLPDLVAPSFAPGFPQPVAELNETFDLLGSLANKKVGQPGSGRRFAEHLQGSGDINATCFPSFSRLGVSSCREFGGNQPVELIDRAL